MRCRLVAGASPKVGRSVVGEYALYMALFGDRGKALAAWNIAATASFNESALTALAQLERNGAPAQFLRLTKDRVVTANFLMAGVAGGRVPYSPITKKGAWRRIQPKDAAECLRCIFHILMLREEILASLGKRGAIDAGEFLTMVTDLSGNTQWTNDFLRFAFAYQITHRHERLWHESVTPFIVLNTLNGEFPDLSYGIELLNRRANGGESGISDGSLRDLLLLVPTIDSPLLGDRVDPMSVISTFQVGSWLLSSAAAFQGHGIGEASAEALRAAVSERGTFLNKAIDRPL